VDFSRLDLNRVLLGGLGSAAVVVSILFLPWYSLDHNPARNAGEGFICGTNNYSCTGFETFPVLRWLLLLGAISPLILAWIIVRGHQLSWAPGEATMVVGFVMIVLIAYNGVLDKPGSGTAEIGISLDYGYGVALLGAIAITATAFLRSQVGQKRERKAPGTV
jgi:hypothetical protein